ncbi:MAG: hypothetical protein FWB96_09320 [Defluviitaleaceae bacterium]|nr:hypothetical protein [Defluviitaleaceae bacterium]MCL2263037.1 hypothetical protein [Defluviitaleaceae bacterium]
MVNRQKIITMTKLALYDKHEGAADRDANDYFRHDYIYRKNLGTRVSVGIAGIVILALHWLRIVFVEGIDVFEINIQDHVMESVLFIVAIIAIYSVIGTIQGTREYYHVQKRLNRYQGMLRFLENAEERTGAPVTEETSRTARLRKEREAARERDSRERNADSERDSRDRDRHGDRDALVRTSDSREPLPLTDRRAAMREAAQNTDPLAKVSSRALTAGRPRTASPLNQRPRPSSRPSELPQVRLNDAPPPRSPRK